MEDIAQETVKIVKAFVEKSVSHLSEKIKELEETVNNFDPKDGKDGKDGEKGDKGDRGEDGRDGRHGKDGRDGLNGVDGIDGKDGQDGIDALELEIQPDIIDNKTYPRGTYAKHKGGLWRSYEKTSGMRGWECLVDGINEISIDFDGERSLSIKTTKSSGETVNKDFKLPVVIERGVFSEKSVYEQSDGVTFGGSYWIAKKDHPEGKPGSSDDWRLSVKAGRNANAPVRIK